jgi:16S rRNA (guanine1207-N2)-methyltransferase
MKHRLPTTPYSQVVRRRFQIGGESIEVASKPGLPGWDQLSPATLLIGEQITLNPVNRVLYLGCGNGAGAATIAKQLITGQLWLHDINYIASQISAETARLNQIADVHWLADINLPAELENYFDVAIIELPKGRKLAQRWLILAFLSLKTGGVLYLGGAKRQGVISVIEDAEMLFGTAAVLGYKKGSRLVSFQKKQPDLPVEGWWHIPGIAPHTWHTFTIQTQPGSFEIRSLPGIFSFDRLDEGTGLLLGTLPDLHNLNVLDLGCGYGAIGLAAAYSGAASVDLLDANLLAVAAAQVNLDNLGLTNAQACASDVLSARPDKKYDLVLSNPPFHTGRDVDYQVAGAFIEQSYGALESTGRLYVVANRFIRYEKILEMYFQQVDLIVQTPRFQVLRGSKSPNPLSPGSFPSQPK